MLHDEIIHRFDVELALGEPGPLDPDLAVDGVRDWLTTVAMLSAAELGIAGDGQTLHLQATEDDRPAGDWMVERTPGGATWRVGAEPADVQVRGPVLEVLLVLNRRRPPDGLEITGDADVFAHWLDHSRF
jgi:hypothetical protein